MKHIYMSPTLEFWRHNPSNSVMHLKYVTEYTCNIGFLSKTPTNNFPLIQCHTFTGSYMKCIAVYEVRTTLLQQLRWDLAVRCPRPPGYSVGTIITYKATLDTFDQFLSSEREKQSSSID